MDLLIPAFILGILIGAVPTLCVMIVGRKKDLDKLAALYEAELETHYDMGWDGALMDEEAVKKAYGELFPVETHDWDDVFID